MMQILPLCAVITTALAAATVRVRQTDNTTDAKKVLIGGGPTGMVGAADFDGSAFTIVANETIAGTSASWMLFKEPNLLYAVNENSDDTRLFNVSDDSVQGQDKRSRDKTDSWAWQFDPDTNDLTLVQNATGSSGVVFLEFNKDKTVMAGAAFGNGSIDFWDVSAADGTMTLIKQVAVGGTPGPVVGRQDTPRM